MRDFNSSSLRALICSINSRAVSVRARASAREMKMILPNRQLKTSLLTNERTNDRMDERQTGKKTTKKK